MPKQDDAEALQPSADYVRIKDREEEAEGDTFSSEKEDPFEPDDGLPF